MWHHSEECEPEIERRQKDDGSHCGGKTASRWRNDLLKNKKWQGRESQDEPQVKVQNQILEVERPGFSAVKIWSAALREDIVVDDIP